MIELGIILSLVHMLKNKELPTYPMVQKVLNTELQDLELWASISNKHNYKHRVNIMKDVIKEVNDCQFFYV